MQWDFNGCHTLHYYKLLCIQFEKAAPKFPNVFQTFIHHDHWNMQMLHAVTMLLLSSMNNIINE